MFEDKPQKNDQSRTLKPEDIRYDLTSDQLNAYLLRVRPDGYSCPVCGHKKWSAAERGFPDGGFRALPDSISQEDFLKFETIPVARMLACAPGNYHLICSNCAHAVGFNAGFVAARTALWDLEKP